MIINLSMAMQYFVNIGFYFQKKWNDEDQSVGRTKNVLENGNGQIKFLMTVVVMMLLFYFISSYLAFLAYREFKGLFEDQMGSLSVEGNNIMSYGTLPDRNE